MSTRNHRLRRILLAACVALSIMACGLAYWSVWRAADLNSREDNPRVLERELRIQRGPILTANGDVAAENVGTQARQERVYPPPLMGHVVGYASLIHGTSGVEESMNATLRGDTLSGWASAVREALHLPQVGQGVVLTLDSELQQTATALLDGTLGAAVVVEVASQCEADCASRLISAVSAPAYDPNFLNAEFDALVADARSPLLNRAVQGQYQPGLTIQPALVAAALAEGRIRLDETVANADALVPINGTPIGCASLPPVPTTWADVVRHACPAPMVALGNQWGTAGLSAVFEQFQLTTPPALRLDTETPPSEPLADAGLAAIGQDNLSVTPLQVALALAALAANGIAWPPQVVSAEQDTEFAWQTLPPLAEATRAVSAEGASAIRPLLPTSGLRVLSGPEGSTNGWYQAIVEAGDKRYAVVVVVEGDQGTQAQAIGQTLSQTLQQRP